MSIKKIFNRFKFTLNAKHVKLKSNQKAIYLMGWNYKLTEQSEFEDKASVYSIKSEDYNIPYFTTQLIFEEGILKYRYEYQRVVDEVVSVQERPIGENRINYIDLKSHEMIDILKSEIGRSHIGGKLPDDFTLPTLTNGEEVHYLGKFSTKDSVFNWLPFDLHLIHPLKMSFNQIFYDYSDHLRPKIIDEQQIKIYQIDNSYELSVGYTLPRTNLKFIERGLDGISLGEVGIPMVEKPYLLPKCPKSEQIMKFVGSIRYSWLSKNVENYTKLENHKEDKPLEEIGFDNMGSLDIFIDINTKTVCYIPEP